MRAFKLVCTLAAATFIIVCVAVLPERLAFDCGEKYTFYVGDTSKNCRVVTVKDSPALKKLTLKDVCGEATTFKSLDISEFLKQVNGKIIFTEELTDSANYYCTADLPYSVNLYGTEINLHICVREEGVTVASPIIFGGY